jgi:hypothetical protein
MIEIEGTLVERDDIEPEAVRLFQKVWPLFDGYSADLALSVLCNIVAATIRLDLNGDTSDEKMMEQIEFFAYNVWHAIQINNAFNEGRENVQ